MKNYYEAEYEYGYYNGTAFFYQEGDLYADLISTKIPLDQVPWQEIQAFVKTELEETA